MTTEFEKACTKHGVTLKLDYRGEDVSIEGEVFDLWQATITYRKNSFTAPFKTRLDVRPKKAKAWNAVPGSYLHKQVFNVADVIHALMWESDANNQSFDDWCDERAYDTDSIRCLMLYIEQQRNQDKLVELFPDDVLKEFLRSLHCEDETG